MKKDRDTCKSNEDIIYKENTTNEDAIVKLQPDVKSKAFYNYEPLNPLQSKL